MAWGSTVASDRGCGAQVGPQGALVSPAIPAGGEPSRPAAAAEMGGFGGSGMK